MAEYVDHTATAKLRDFMRMLREYVEQQIDEQPPEELIERLVATVSALIATAMLFSQRLRHEGLLTLLVAIISRFVSRSRPRRVVDQEVDRGR